MASHRGAAWLWDLLPDMHREIAAPRARLGPQIAIHRLAGDVRVVPRRGVPCTDALRTVVDLAALRRPAQVAAQIWAALIAAEVRA